MKKFTILKRESTNRKMLREDVDNSTTPTQQTPEDVGMQKSGIVQFFSKLFESREMAHIYHLQVKGEEGSFAKHKALGEYYEGVVGLIDDIIEIYMGQYDVIEGYDSIDTTPTRSVDPIEYFNGIASYIKSEKLKCISSEDTHLLNIVDEIQSLIYKLLYKLKYNK
jgi:hypothetical protein